MQRDGLKSIIIDDEWLVREELKTLLAEFPRIEVIGEAGDVSQAVELISKLRPDVLFLDIQMPGASGFDLIERVDTDAQIVFITAYDQYALKAFEVNALDYLLKPIRRERLQQTVRRLLTRKAREREAAVPLGYDDMLYLMIDGSVKFIKLSLLKCIVAVGNYSYIYYQDRKRELVTKTLQDWQTILPDKEFVRIHRSTIVNFNYVEAVKKCKNYSQLVYIRDLEKPLAMSRRYATKLKKTFSR